MFEIDTAKGKRKCRECGGAIPRGTKCANIWVDTGYSPGLSRSSICLKCMKKIRLETVKVCNSIED